MAKDVEQEIERLVRTNSHPTWSQSELTILRKGIRLGYLAAKEESDKLNEEIAALEEMIHEMTLDGCELLENESK